MPFEGDMFFSKSYLLHMLNSGHLISLSVLKIFLSTIQLQICFLCDINTLNYVCDFLYDLCDHLLFKKKLFCGPRISIARMRFPLDGETRFLLFEKLIFIDYLKMTWSRHLFLFYF